MFHRARNHFNTLRTCAMLFAAWVSHGSAAELRGSLADDGKSLVLESPGLLAMRAGFHAVVEREGRRSELLSTSSTASVERISETEVTPFGNSTIEQSKLGFEANACDLLLRFGRIPGAPFVTVQSGVTNTGTEPIRLISTSPLSMAGPREEATTRRVFLETRMASSIWQPLGPPVDHLSSNKTPIRLAGETFSRGIGCLSPSDMRFPLYGKFTRFQTVAGVDDSGGGSVTFEVRVDGRTIFESGQVLSGQPGRVIDLDITGAKELQLIVTNAGDGSNFDLADWANASLTPMDGIDSVLPPADAPLIRLQSPLADWLAGPMLGRPDAAPPSPLDRAFDPLRIHEAGGLYDTSGRGLFFGPVGEAVTYVQGTIGNAGNPQVTLDLDCTMDSVEVAPGETRWGQQVMISFESPEAARERWISWVANTHQARPPRDPLSGWLSWYWLGMNVSENHLLEVVDFTTKSNGVLRPGVFQIDDGYQMTGSQLEINAKFPSGISGVASKINATGALPGLLARAETYDPEGAEPFFNSIRKSVADGIRYLKISDFSIPAGLHETQTSFERKRAFYQSIRQASGNDTYLLAAANVPDRACVGAVDACRISGSMERHKVPTGVDSVLRSLALNRRWFTVDTDCYYLATDIDQLAPISGAWPMLRTWLSITGLACGNVMTSDPWHWKSMAPFLRHTEILTPPASETAHTLDLGTASGLSRVVGHVTRPWGTWSVALLWNSNSQAKEVTLDFSKAGMNPELRYAVWSFWENRFLGIAEKTWTSPALEPMASQHLCFTPLGEDPLKPTIIGSNLHIWCGAAEFEQVSSLHGAMEVRLNDAGARKGNLFIHCGSRPEIRVANACEVSAIESLGENIWRVSLTDRQPGMPQRIEFGVYRKVTEQAWFWLLIVLLISSLVFAAWRYLDNLRARTEIARLQQKSALEEERARIARDLHDELGANLARIGLLTELADHAMDDPAKARVQLDSILDATRGLRRQLDSVVWAVDPANDTLESLARYLHGHAEDYLAIAGIRCCFEASELPEMPLSSSLRHHLLMITKEALHNIVKHAQATTATVRLSLTGSRLTLSVEDNGCGCTPSGDGRRRGNGLNNMAKRAQAAGGRIEIGSGSKGLGTRVVFYIDLPATA